MKDLKLLVLDVDGILTDGRKNYSANGTVISKQFCDLDFSAIKIFTALGVNVILLTGDSWNMCLQTSRSIKTYVSRAEDGTPIDKGSMLNKLSQIHEVNCDQIWYAGDDLFDLPAFTFAKYSSAPTNAPEYVKKLTNIKINEASGNYFVSKMLERYISETGIVIDDQIINKVLYLDSQEATSKNMA